MENNVGEIKGFTKTGNFDYHKLLNPEYDISKDKVDKMALLYKKYSAKSRIKYDTPEESEVQEVDVIREIENEALETISSSELELSNLAIYVCYELFPKQSKSFIWKFFGGDCIVQTLMTEKDENEFLVPVLDNFGDIEYLGKKYSLRRIK
jgi:hypothetical protein